MFFLVEKKKQKNCVERNNDAAIPIQLWCFSPSFSLKLHQLAQSTAFFMLPWHLSYSESTLWNLWLTKKKKKKKSYIRPQWCVAATEHTTMFWTCVIWWLMLTLSALFLIYLQLYWTIGNRNDCRNSASGAWVRCKESPTPLPRSFFYAL